MIVKNKAKVIKDVEIKTILPEEKITIGQVSQIKVVMKPKENMWLRYIFFELLNERTDKRAPKDRITSRSRYHYRYNVDETIANKEESQYIFPMRIPIHKEPSRDDKFICIKWQLHLKAYMSATEEDNELLQVNAPSIEVQIF